MKKYYQYLKGNSRQKTTSAKVILILLISIAAFFEESSQNRRVGQQTVTKLITSNDHCQDVSSSFFPTGLFCQTARTIVPKQGVKAANTGQQDNLNTCAQNKEIKLDGIHHIVYGMESISIIHKHIYMSVIGGYQSDTNLQNIKIIGDFPIENSLGGFGVTSGNDDDFELALNPPLTEYRIGLKLDVRFNHPNAGAATINVNQLGVIPLMKVVDGNLQDLALGDLDAVKLNTLKFDGACFQIIIPIVTGMGGNVANTMQALTIRPDHISPKIFHEQNRNRYAAINGNLIVSMDIRVKPSSGLFVSGHVINLPKPLEPSAFFSQQILASQGRLFFMTMNGDGKLTLSGNFSSVNEEIILTLNPYLARLPIEYNATAPPA